MSRKSYTECHPSHKRRMINDEYEKEMKNISSDDEMDYENYEVSDIENASAPKEVEKDINNLMEVENNPEEQVIPKKSLSGKHITLQDLNENIDDLEVTLNTMYETFYDCEDTAYDSDEDFSDSSSSSSDLTDVGESDESQVYLSEDEDIDTEKCKVSKNCPLKKKIKDFSVKLNRELANELLQILREIGHEELPKDKRSLVKTPKITNLIPCNDGEYFHYGVKEAILGILKKYKLNKVINIDIGIDGLPLSNSSNQKLWPIIGKIIGNDDVPPFVIGAYYGAHDPDGASPFLDQLVMECKELKENGIHFNEKDFQLNINRIICDIPARCLCTCTKYYTGHYGCGKCDIKGERVGNKTVFLDQDGNLRTNESFRNREQPEHHHNKSPFEDIEEINMVKSFPIDYMHAVCLGVMRLLLIIWFRGNKKKDVKPMLGSKAMQLASNAFTIFGKFLPKEFNRKPQPLKEIGRWKATVLRYFLLYAGPVIMKTILRKRYYKHFNKLSCAIRILCDPVHYKLNNHTADKLLKSFVKDFETLYGKQYITINLHSLIHLADEVLNNDGPLDTFSAFPFENYMQFIKRILKKRNKPLQQLHRRLVEGCRPKKKKRVEFPTLKNYLKKELPLDCVEAHKRLILPTIEFSIDSPNNCCLIENNVYVVITGIGKKNGNIVIIGKRFKKVMDLSSYPVKSNIINTCVVSDLSKNVEVFEVQKITSKVCLFMHNDTFYASKLLH